MGANELTALKSLITSNLGLVFAVAVTLYGAYLILVKGQTSLGIIILLAGSVVGFFPGLLEGIRNNFCPAVTMLGGTCGGVSYGSVPQVNGGANSPASNSGNPNSATPADIGTDGKAINPQGLQSI